MQTLLTYLKLQLMIFVFGIVGPIFLVLFFVIDDPAVKWMYYAGLIITAFDVLIALGLTSSTVRGRELAARRTTS